MLSRPVFQQHLAWFERCGLQGVGENAKGSRAGECADDFAFNDGRAKRIGAALDVLEDGEKRGLGGVR